MAESWTEPAADPVSESDAALTQSPTPQPDLPDRRHFIKSAAAGITILFSLDPFDVLAQRPGGRQGYPTDLNAYLRIQPDGRVRCLVGKIEMGQGASISLPQLLAEELDVSIDSVDVTMGDTDLCPWDAGTWGSQSIRIFGPVLRAAAAEAREILLQLASERLEVPREKLKAENGVIADISSPSKRVTYAELAEGGRIERTLQQKPALKAPGDFKVIGKSVPRREAVAKVTGGAKYAGDIRLRGMLYARLLRPPAHGAGLKSLDTSAAERMAGVKVVKDSDLVAVLHELPDQADRALAALRAEWDVPAPSVDERTIFAHILKASAPGQVVAEGGNLQEGAGLAKTTSEATYYNSYVAHAAMETHTALAQLDNGRYTLWVSTQSPFGVKSQVAQAVGVDPANVRVITPYVGGGFGGKSASRQAVEAARLAKLTGRPIQVCWTRPEEFFFDTFRPAAVVKIRSGSDAAGKIVLWDFEVFAAGDREAKQFYEVPHQRTVSHGGWGGGGSGTPVHPFATGPWRAPAVNTNTFARESHIDAMAEKAGLDRLEFRLRNLKDPRMIRVLKTAAEKFGWVPSVSPSRRGYGIACAMYLGTYIATMAEVAVDPKTGHVRVKRVVCAHDTGLIINPGGLQLQVEGSIMMGLGYALTEELHFRSGQINDRNFDTYEIPKFSWVPEIDTILIDAPEHASQGGGEPAIVCMGAVVSSAVYDAAAIRLYQLPMTPERVRAALEKRTATA